MARFGLKFLFLGLVLFQLSASGAIVMKGKSQARMTKLFGSSGMVTSQFSSLIEDDRMRQDMVTGRESQTTIIRSDKKVVWILDHKKKTYVELNEQMAKEIRKQYELIRKDKRSALIFDNLMKAALDVAKVDRFEAKGSDTALGRSCDNYYGYRRGQKTMEVCVIPNGYFSNARAATKKSVSAMKFLIEMFPDEILRKHVNVMIESSAVHLGFPVKVKYSYGGHFSGSTEVTELYTKWFADASQFEIPAGYRLVRSR